MASLPPSNPLCSNNGSALPEPAVGPVRRPRPTPLLSGSSLLQPRRRRTLQPTGLASGEAQPPTPPQARAMTQPSRGTVASLPKAAERPPDTKAKPAHKAGPDSAPPSPVLTRALRRSFSTQRRPGSGSGSGSGSLTPAAHAPTSPPTAEQPPSSSARSLLAGACCLRDRL